AGPRIDVERASVRSRAWVERQMVPTVMVASQTRIVECAVNADADRAIGVPGLVVIPHDPAEVWNVASALGAPCVSAWLLRRSVGTGMSTDALRPTAPLLSSVPTPTDAQAWESAAALARRLSSTDEPTETAWLDYARTAD